MTVCFQISPPELMDDSNEYQVQVFSGNFKKNCNKKVLIVPSLIKWLLFKKNVMYLKFS